jgi:hypothetical protein
MDNSPFNVPYLVECILYKVEDAESIKNYRSVNKLWCSIIKKYHKKYLKTIEMFKYLWSYDQSFNEKLFSNIVKIFIKLNFNRILTEKLKTNDDIYSSVIQHAPLFSCVQQLRGVELINTFIILCDLLNQYVYMGDMSENLALCLLENSKNTHDFCFTYILKICDIFIDIIKTKMGNLRDKIDKIWKNHANMVSCCSPNLYFQKILLILIFLISTDENNLNNLYKITVADYSF